MFHRKAARAVKPYASHTSTTMQEQWNVYLRYIGTRLFAFLAGWLANQVVKRSGKIQKTEHQVEVNLLIRKVHTEVLVSESMMALGAFRC